MSHLEPIYDVWNGNAESMAKAIAERGVTVRQWRYRGNIPPHYWRKIIDAAAKRGTNLELADFLPQQSEAA